MDKPMPDLFKYLESHHPDDTNQTQYESKIWEKFGTTCAPFVLDSSGFTRTTQSEGIIYFLDCVVRMRKMAVPVLEKHDCLSYRMETDNIFAEFPHPTQALKAAMELIEIINKARIRLNDREYYRVGIGIGYGKVLQTAHEGVFGDEMNLASKLGEDLGSGNEIMLTEAAFKAIDPDLKDPFSLHSVRVSGVDIDYYHLLYSGGLDF